MKHKCRPGSPAAILMGSHHHDHHRSHESKEMHHHMERTHHHAKRHHHADGGLAAPSMNMVGERRAYPNLDQRFKRGGRAGGGQMDREDALRSEGSYSSRGSEMNREDRRRSHGGAMKKTHYASGGDIGTNTGSSIARKPGEDGPGFRKGGHAMHRAMGGAGKTRKHYPFT